MIFVKDFGESQLTGEGHLVLKFLSLHFSKFLKIYYVLINISYYVYIHK